MILRQRKYRKTIKDQEEDVHGAHLNPSLLGQPPSNPGTYLSLYFGLYFRPISLQLEAGREPHPGGFVIQKERPWQGNTTPPGTYPQTLTLIKVDLGPCYLFVHHNRLHTAFMSKRRDTKTTISSAYADTFAERGQQNECRVETGLLPHS